MKKVLSVALLAIAALTVNAQEKDPVLLTVGGKEVKLSEFNAIYNKNNSKEKITKESIQEYLDLYIKFKLKVKEAEDLGLDTIPKFIGELKGYRRQLAEPYLTDKEVTEDLIKEAYDRMKTDVSASHILVAVKKDASPSDTLIAYNKIMKARKRIMAGEDFVKVAEGTSEDPSVKKNGGDLGYFSAFHMVYPFESAAYNTKVGEISKPVRTQFGYHILKVVDKRDARGTIKVSHIMVKHNKTNTEDRKKIDELYAKLTTEGANFSELAKQFSDDKGSARKGGSLPEFNAGKMVASFENAAFGLGNDGDISAPVKTDFGWHIIKRESLKGLEPFDKLYNTLKVKVTKDSRSNQSKVALYNKIKEENNFKENIKERNDFYKLVKAEDYVQGNFDASNTAKYDKLMFGYYANDGEKLEYTQRDFAQYIQDHKYRGDKKNRISINAEINRMYKNIVNVQGVKFKDSRLSKTNEEFRLLMKEYRDGILLFDLTDEKVWSKAVKDSAGLYGFYNSNKMKYMWKKRAEATIYTCTDEAVAKNVEKLLKKRAKKGYSNDDILKMINVESQLALKIEEDKYSKGDNEYVDAAVWEKGKFSKTKKDAGVIIVEIKYVLVAAPKELDEIRGLITSDYQNHLEKEWVKELKSKYKVVVDKEVLKLVK